MALAQVRKTLVYNNYSTTINQISSLVKSGLTFILTSSLISPAVGRRPKDVVSYNMSRIRSRDTKVEAELETILKIIGLEYVSHPKVYGNPDFVYPELKIAIFADSAFWHGYDWENRKNDIKTNREFWLKKIENTISRDREVTQTLEMQGWIVIRLWDFELHRQPDKCKVVLQEAIAHANSRR
jgi:DNA mismatch endonuclease (patch repair protein)